MNWVLYVIILGLVLFAGRQWADLRRVREQRNILRLSVLELTESRRRDAEIIGDLQWQVEASAFMLEATIEQLPEGHALNLRDPRVEEPAEKSEKILKDLDETVEMIRVELQLDVVAKGPIPAPRDGGATNGPAYFKDTA